MGMDLLTTLFTTRGAGTAVSKRLGISPAAVSQWRARGIPEKREADVAEALRDHLGSMGVAVTAEAAPAEAAA